MQKLRHFQVLSPSRIRSRARYGLQAVLSFLACLLLAGQDARAEANLLPNAGFEEGTRDWHLFVPTDTPPDSCLLEVTEDHPHTGARCLRIKSSKPVRFAAASRSIAVQAGQRFQLSAWVRVPASFAATPGTPGVLARVDYPSKDNVFGKQLVLVTLEDKVAPTSDISRLTNSAFPSDWKKIHGVFEVPEGASLMFIELFIWSGQGEVFWDDVELIPVDRSTPLSALPKEAPRSKETLNPEDLLPENPSWAANHPRIVLDAATLDRVRASIKEPATPPYLAWERLVKRCDEILGKTGSAPLDLRQPFAGLEHLVVSTHKEQGVLEDEIRRWTTPCELLAFRYAVTGDAPSGRAAADIALYIARNLPPNTPNLGKGFFYTRTMLVRALAFSFDWCYPVFTPDERQEMRAALGLHARRLYVQSLNSIWGQSTLGRIWNWNPGIASAWGLAMLAEMGETNFPDRQWVFQATRNVEDYFRFAVDAKGAAIEGPCYLSYGAGASAFFIEALRKWSGEDLFETTNLKLFANWLPYDILPSGKRINNILDSNYKINDPDYVLYTLSRLKDKHLAQWAWQNLQGDGIGWNSSGDIPVILWWQKQPETQDPRLPLADYAPGRSLVVARSGWDKDAVYFSLHAQQYTDTKHDQADKGQFTLYGYGEDFAIDSGYGNDCDPEKSFGTKAHNLILINGNGQASSKAQAHTSGWIRGFAHSDLADWAWADAKDAYEFYYSDTKKAGVDEESYKKIWVNHIRQANRQALFVRGKLPYVVLFDDIRQNDEPQTYTWLLHIPNGKTFDIRDHTVTVSADLQSAKRFGKAAVQPTGSAGIDGVGAPIQQQRQNSGTWRKEIEIPADGNYEVWGYTGTDAIHPESANSFYFSIDDGKADFTKGKTSREFVWATHPGSELLWEPLNDDNGSTKVPSIALKAGRYVLQFRTREEGAWMAALCLVPQGETPLRRLAIDQLPPGSLLISAAEGQIQAPMKLVGLPWSKSKAEMQMTVLSPEDFQYEQTIFETTTQGVHPRLALSSHSVQPNFLMVLVPRPLDLAKPEPTPIVRPVAMQKGVGGTVSADPGGDDLIARWDGHGIENKDLITDAQLFWMRKSPANGCVAVRGTRLTWKGKTLFQSTGESTLVFDGKTLNVSAESIAEVRHAFGGDVLLCVNGKKVLTKSENGVSVWRK